MRTAKSILLMIVFTVPFLFVDLYTKYLAHIELPNQGDEIVLMKPIYAVSPIRNYGSIFKSEADKEKAHHLTHILLWPTVILGLFLIAFYNRHFLYYMALGGGLGNGIEVAIFDGGTDFLNTKKQFVLMHHQNYIVVSILFGFQFLNN